MSAQLLTRSAVAALVAFGLLAPFSQAGAQEAPRDCTVQREPGGMVRGDRVPSGCLLSDERREPGPEVSAGLFVVCEEAIVHTPNARRILLENCVRLSDGRLVIPIAAFGTGFAGRGFMPIDRHFEPLLRPFGPLKRPFGPLDRKFEPLERPFGSSGPRQSAERPPGRTR